MCCDINGDSGLHSWGLPFTQAPFSVQCDRYSPEVGYFYWRVWFFSLIHTTLWTLSCPPVTRFCCIRCSTFSPFWTWSSDAAASVAERSQTCSQSTVFTLSSKNSYGCNICIPFLWFEGKTLQCFFTYFLIGGMTKARLKSELWVSCMATFRVSSSGPGPALERALLLLLCLCCMITTHHLPPVVLPPAPAPWRLKSKTEPHFLPQLEEKYRSDSVIAWSTFRFLALVFYLVCGCVFVCAHV